MPNSSAYYRRSAEKCIRLAETMTSLQAKARLLEIAQAWYSLAEYRQRQELDPLKDEEIKLLPALRP